MCGGVGPAGWEREGGGEGLDAPEDEDAKVEREAVEAALLALFGQDRELEGARGREDRVGQRRASWAE